jgi:hypothetical protein
MKCCMTQVPGSLEFRVIPVICLSGEQKTIAVQYARNELITELLSVPDRHSAGKCDNHTRH